MGRSRLPVPAVGLAQHLLGVLMGVRVLARVRPERSASRRCDQHGTRLPRRSVAWRPVGSTCARGAKLGEAGRAHWAPEVREPGYPASSRQRTPTLHREYTKL